MTRRVYAEWLDRSFEVADLGPYWNGFATPLVTKAQALEIIEAHNAAAANNRGLDLLAFHTDENGNEWVELDEYGAGRDKEATCSIRIDAGPDGLFDIGFGWVWTEDEDEEN